MTLIPKDKYTEPAEDIAGKGRIASYYHEINVVLKASYCFLGCFLNPRMKYEAVHKSYLVIEPHADHTMRSRF